MLRGSLGGINVGAQAYADSLGSGTAFDTQPDSAYSGEFGVVIRSSDRINTVASFEYLTVESVHDAVGSRGLGPVTLMKVDSKMYAGIVWFGWEFVLVPRAHSQILLGLQGGFGQVTLENGVRMTAAGMAHYTQTATSNNFEERGSGAAGAGRVTLGWEFLMSANITMTIEGGYRYFMVPLQNFTAAVDSVNGHYNDGSEMKNNANQSRPLDLSGGFGGLNFRFYF